MDWLLQNPFALWRELGDTVVADMLPSFGGAGKSCYTLN